MNGFAGKTPVTPTPPPILCIARCNLSGAGARTNPFFIPFLYSVTFPVVPPSGLSVDTVRMMWSNAPEKRAAAAYAVGIT